MNTYINTILTVSIVGGIVNSIAPIKSGIKKYVSYIVALICVLCLISPLSNLILNTNSIKEKINSITSSIILNEKINSANDLIVSTSTEHICNGIKESLISEFNFDDSEIFVDLTLDKANIEAIRIKCVNITLTGKASWSDAKRVREYLEDLIGTEIEVKKK